MKQHSEADGRRSGVKGQPESRSQIKKEEKEKEGGGRVKGKGRKTGERTTVAISSKI